MDGLFWIDVVSRIVHIATAITLVGGSVFLAFVLHPIVKAMDDSTRELLQSQVVGRWKWLVHVGILLFLLSGFYNYFRAIGAHQGDGMYHGLIGTKMLLAFWVMFLASALVGRSARFSGMRANRGFWLKVLVGSALLIVILSGFAKVRGVPEGGADNDEPIPIALRLPSDAAIVTRSVVVVSELYRC